MANLGDNTSPDYVSQYLNVPVKNSKNTLGTTDNSGDTFDKQAEQLLTSSTISDTSGSNNSYLEDRVRLYGAATGKAIAGGAEIGKRLGLVEQDTVDKLTAQSEEIESKISPEYQKERSKKIFNEDNTFNGDYSTTTLGADIIGSIPGVISGIAAGLALEPVVAGAGALAGVGEGLAAITKAFPTVARMAESIPGVGSTASKLNSLVASSVAQGSGEGLVSASDSAINLRKKAISTPLSQLRDVPAFKEAVASMDSSIPLLEREAKARVLIADKASDQAFSDTFAATAGIGALTGGGATGTAARILENGVGSITKSILKSSAESVAKEGLQEVLQSGGETLAANLAEKDYINNNKSLTDGLLDAMAKGGVTGGLMGGALGASTHIANNLYSIDGTSKSTEEIKSSINTNPITGTEWANPGIKSAYSDYNGLIAANIPHTDPSFIDRHTAVVNSLEGIISTEQGKETNKIDHIKIDEAKNALTAIHQAYDAKRTLAEQDTERAKISSDAIESATSPLPTSIEPSLITESSTKIEAPGKQESEVAKVAEKVATVSQDITTPLPDESPTMQEILRGTDRRVNRDTVSQYLKPDRRAPVDTRTGLLLNLKDSHPKAVEAAIAHSEATGEEAHFVTADIANLGGANALFKDDQVAVDEQVIKPLAIIFKEEMAKAGATVKSYRPNNGGDEMTSVITGGTSESVQIALENIKARSEAFAKEKGFDTTPNPKKGKTAGIGMHVAFTPITAGMSFKEVNAKANETLKAKTQPVDISQAAIPLEVTVGQDVTVDTTVSTMENGGLSDKIAPEIIQKYGTDIPAKVEEQNGDLVTLSIPKLDNSGVEIGRDLVSVDKTLVNNPALSNESNKVVNALQANKKIAQDIENKGFSDTPINTSATSTVQDLLNELDGIRSEINDYKDALLDQSLSTTQKELYSEAKAREKDIVSQLESLGSTVPSKASLRRSKRASLGAMIENDIDPLDLGLEPIDFEDDTHSFDLSPDKATVLPLLEDHIKNKALFTKLVGDLDSNAKPYLSDSILSSTRFVLIENFRTENWAKHGINPESMDNLRGAAGVVIRVKDSNGIEGKPTVYMNQTNDSKSFAGTFMHEVVGHVGIRNIINNSTIQQAGSLSKYDSFLLNLMNSNEVFKQEVLERHSRWAPYVNTWAKKIGLKSTAEYNAYMQFLPKEEKATFDIELRGVKQKVTVPVSVAIQYADEHMAELAKEVYFNEKELQRLVGLGLPVGERSAVQKRNKRIVDTFINKIVHLLRSVFSPILGVLNHSEIKDVAMASVALSYDYVFRGDIARADITDKVNPSAKQRATLSLKNKVISNEEVDSWFNYDLIDDQDSQLESMQLPEEEITNRFLVNAIPDIDRLISLQQSDFGSLNSNIRNKFWNTLKTKFNNNPLLSSLQSLGSMNHKDAYNTIQNIYKGQLASTIDEKTSNLLKSIQNIDSIQNEAMFKYFVTKDASIDDVPLTAIQKTQVVKMKEAIRELGLEQVKLGLLSQEVFDKNEDAYLHTTYLKYIDEYRGHGKKASYMSYLRKKKDKSEVERLALGQIKDVRFLVAETVGIMGRDTILMQMFDALNTASINNGLHWAITVNEQFEYQGQVFSIESAKEQIDRSSFILSAWDSNDKLTFGGTPENIEIIRAEKLALEEWVVRVEDTAISNAYEAAKASGQSVPDNKADFLDKYYFKVADANHLGAFKGKYVRKEIANDFEAIMKPFSMTDAGIIDKLTAPNGVLEKLNRAWKTSMVGLNPGSWVRNGLGNFALLDLSTSTNKATLINYLVGEVTSVSKGSPSKFWKLAEEHGLFGSTFSANEMVGMLKGYSSDIKKAQATYAQENSARFNEMLAFADDRLLTTLKSLASSVGASAAKIAAFTEGTFKVVAVRDYITNWEQENREEFPNGYDSLTKEQQQVIASKASLHANDTLFDYSQVNSFVKKVRRVPMGSPFLTFTYKAAPVAIKAAVNHPLKFAQYALLPTLLTTIAMAANDWDDDDIDRMRRSLPDYYRDKPNTPFFPFKDKNGKPQILPLDYVLPWGQLGNAAHKVANNYKNSDGTSKSLVAIQSTKDVFDELGFLGGPIPKALAVSATGIDPFTGREIAPKGISGNQKLLAYMKYTWDSAVPSFISSGGWLKKLYDTVSDRTPRDRFGDVKFTGGQIAGQALGIPTKTVDVETGLSNRKIGFEKELREISTYRNKVLRDFKGSDKISELRDIAQREKLIRLRMYKETR